MFYCKLRKCSFFQNQVTFLGHDVDAHGLHINANKIKVIKEWPKPTNLKELQSFLGFVQFFRKFIKNFSETALPLTNLTRKEVQYCWGQPQQQAFESLREAICTAPVLHIIDYEQGGELELHTDASGRALSGVLY